MVKALSNKLRTRGLLQTEKGNALSYLAQAESGIDLRLGALSRVLGSHMALVSFQDLQSLLLAHPELVDESVHATDAEFDHLGDIFDYEVLNFSNRSETIINRKNIEFLISLMVRNFF